jgi:hypothetical protein
MMEVDMDVPMIVVPAMLPPPPPPPLAYARLVGQVLAEVADSPPAPDPATGGLPADWVALPPDQAVPGWLWDGWGAHPPPPPVEEPARFAVLADGVVTGLVLAPPSHAAAMGWVPAPDDVVPGSLAQADGGFAPPPPPPLAARKAEMLAALAALRFDHEAGGTLVAGVPVRTDRDSQGLITGAAVSAMLDPEYRLDWKAVDGWVTLTSPQIIALASAVRAHVQACFDRERTLSVDIQAADADTLDQIDIAAGWPPTL